jgi:phage terminase large subunit
MRTMPLATTGSKQTDRQLAEVFYDPVKYAQGILCHDRWSTQAEMLRAIAQHKRVAAKACHASSKTFTAAEAMLWWITRYTDGIAITTAPKFEQVEKLVFGEIHKALLTSTYPYPKANKTELWLGPRNYLVGLSTNTGIRFQGFHGAHLLVVLDEAPGIEGDIWEALEGARAGGDVHVLALGNPTVAGGPFYDAFAEQRAQWKTFTIDAFETPNLKGFTLERLKSLAPDLPEDHPIFQYQPRPYLITRRWVYEKFWEWGEKSPLWQARVRGQFPEQSDDTLLSLAWLEAAKRRASQSDQSQGRDLVAGVDVAGPGSDECVCYVRQGNSIIALQAWSIADPRGHCVAFLRSFGTRLRSVNVDSAGIGHNFYLHLQDQGFSINPINVGQVSNYPARFVNLKAQYYWALRERFEASEIAGLTDELTISQLSTIRWGLTSLGKTEIESKEDRRRRGLKSPDRAEALMLAFAPEHPAFAFGEQLLERAKIAAEAEARGELLPPAPNPLLEQYNRKVQENRARLEVSNLPLPNIRHWARML